MAGSRGNKKLTSIIRELADQLSDRMDPETGNALTRAEALSDLLWKKALGYEELVQGPEGSMVNVKHAPEAWAIQLIYDRMEGKVAPTPEDDRSRLNLADKVRDLSKSRLNALAAAKAGVEKPLPPKTKREDDQPDGE